LVTVVSGTRAGWRRQLGRTPLEAAAPAAGRSGSSFGKLARRGNDGGIQPAGQQKLTIEPEAVNG